MNEQGHQNLFSELVARHQSELYGYIFAVVRNWEDADDLFQSVCLVLWRKFELFRPGSNFFYWARQVAKIEISNFLRHKPSPSYITDELLDALGETVVATQGDETESYLVALRHCRAKLSPTDEELLKLHYVDDLGSRLIADRLQRPYRSVCNSLNRIRSWLFECIQMELARQEHSGKEHS